MPTYIFTDADGNEKTEFLWISEVEDYLKANPGLKLAPPSSAAQVDPWRMGRKKVDEGFREILRGVKRRYKGSTVETD